VERGTQPIADLRVERGAQPKTDLPLLPGMRSTVLPVHAVRARRLRLELQLLVVLDVLLATLGFVVAYFLRYRYGFLSPVRFDQPLQSFLPTIALLVPTTLGLLYWKGLYHLPRNAGWLTQLGKIVSSVTTAIAVTIVITFLFSPDFYSRLIFLLAWASTIMLLALGRLLINSYRHRRWANGHDLERVLVVGGTGLGRQVMRNLRNSRALGYALVGYVHESLEDGPSSAVSSTGEETPLLGGLEQLPQVVAQRDVHHVIVALPAWQNKHLPRIVEMCHQLGVPFQIVPDFHELSFDRVTIQELRGVPLIGLRENVIRGWNYAVKRALDVGLVVVTLPLWGMLSLFIMLLIRLDSPGPVIFRQTRLGRKERPFEFLKFRTMVTNAEELKAELMEYNENAGPHFKIKHDPRCTRVGRVLRRTSLDEIPQLWNVLRGEMSLVGPRPAVPEEVAQYEPWHRRRMEVMPGCTGLWQATGRSNTTFDEMVRLDIYYAEHWSVWFDLKILLLSIPAVVLGRGAY
jgi:exopolysaccharide biosynthesis polyprenyl glycosylphosphotransferase